MDDESGDEEFLHAPGVKLAHLVEIHVAFEGDSHGLSELLLIAVASDADGSECLCLEESEDGAHHLADKVVFRATFP